MIEELKTKIHNAYNDDRCKSIIESDEFYFQKAKDILEQFLSFEVNNEQREFLLQNRKSYDLLKNKFEQDIEYKELGTLLFTLVSYCDSNAYRKQELNAYPDKRVLALAFVRMNNWVDQLLAEKFGLSVPEGSVKNAIMYLKDPVNNFTMLSENHRVLLSENLFRKGYISATVTQDLISFFEPLSLQVVNRVNYTHLLARICYMISAAWKQEIIGLLVADGTGWQEKLVDSVFDGVALWNHKKATGTDKTYKLLRDCIEEHGSFKIFYSSGHMIRYVAEVVDFVHNQKELELAKWPEEYGEIEGYGDNFASYQDDNKKASVIYLAKKFYRIDPISSDNFRYMGDYSYPSVGSQTPVVSYITNKELEVMENLNKVLKLLQYKKQIILQGPPGTGKTRLAKQIAEALTKAFDPIERIPEDLEDSIIERFCNKPVVIDSAKNDVKYVILGYAGSVVNIVSSTNTVYNVKFAKIKILYKQIKETVDMIPPDGSDTYPYVIARYIHSKLKDAIENPYVKTLQFHPSYTYEDFIRGISADANETGISYRAADRTLVEMANKAIQDPECSYILILDEINRANLSSVLGELIYALEYRGEDVESMYEVGGSNKISLPPNLYIIGTMNTADRSVGHIDYAIRRRFAFVDVHPEKLTDTDKIWFNTQGYEKVEKLFTRTNVSNEFDVKDIQLGHSYFIVNKEKNNDPITRDELFAMKMNYEIKPILLEYVKDGILIGKIGTQDVTEYIEEL